MELTPGEQKALELAVRQHGALTRRQALALGMTANQIHGRRESGLWTPKGRGVVVMKTAPPTRLRDISVARLRGGETAVVSHRTAGALWGICDMPPIPEISVPRP